MPQRTITITLDHDDLPDRFYLSLPCPTCGSKTDRNCRFPDGRVMGFSHVARVRAVEAGALDDLKAAAVARLEAARQEPAHA